MSISLIHALGLQRDHLRLAIAGAGGKTSALFRISRQLLPPVIITTTTHIAIGQAVFADECVIINHPDELTNKLNTLNESNTVFFTGGPSPDGRYTSLDLQSLELLATICDQKNLPLLLEADGARGLPLKAPEAHEPAIPGWTNTVLVVEGMHGLERPLDEKTVHRVGKFSEITGLMQGEIISSGDLAKYLLDPRGGLKNIPPGARKLVLLNQADSETLLSQAKAIAEQLNPVFECVAVGSMLPEEDRFGSEIEAVYTPTCSIILAAGGSERLGQPKALFSWKDESLVHRAARIALAAGLSPVIIIAGDEFDPISREISDLNVVLVHNPEWRSGQSTSLKTGLRYIPQQCGASVFQVVDQPGLTESLIRALIQRHRQTRAKIIRPIVAGSTANPVLFDRATFSDLEKIEGDKGGRAIFHLHSVSEIPWHDPGILFDLDIPEDIERLRDLE